MSIRAITLYFLTALSSFLTLITYVYVLSSTDFIVGCAADFGAALPFPTILLFNTYDFLVQHPFIGCIAFFFIPFLCILLALTLHFIKEMIVLPLIISIIPLILCSFCFFSSYVPFLKIASLEEEFLERERQTPCTFNEAAFRDIRYSKLSLP